MTTFIPEGFTTITPSLNLPNAQEAIDLYKKALGAKEIAVMKSPDGSGKIMHAVLEIGNSKLFLADEFSKGEASASKSSFYLYVPDVDAAFKQATQAGLTSTMPVTDMFWGDRLGAVTDKFGISWTIATHTRDVSDDEMKKGAVEFAKNMNQKAA
jgi:PhnB protein